MIFDLCACVRATAGGHVPFGSALKTLDTFWAEGGDWLVSWLVSLEHRDALVGELKWSVHVEGVELEAGVPELQSRSWSTKI